jgi:RNA polymerase sigma-70 factor (ECF subfamily)
MPFDAGLHTPLLERGRAMIVNGVMSQASAQGGNGPLDESSLNRLIQAIATDRDRSAFAAVFGHFGPRIKAYLMRRGSDAGAAEEVVQEVMVTLWRRAETFDARQANASTWVFTIARNKRIDMMRRERRPEIDPEDPALVPAENGNAEDRVERAQDAARLRGAMASLPAEQKDLLTMAFFEDKPHSTIAAESGLPLGTVKSRIRLAMARLRKELGDA